MENINTADELYDELKKLDSQNSVLKFAIPGMGNFALVFEGDERTIQEEVKEDKALERMIHESRKEYKKGQYKSTSQIIGFIQKK